MSALIYRLYNALGLETPEEDVFIKLDDDLEVYFNESEAGLEMCCPLMPLPNDIEVLQHCLQMNYASPVIISADGDNTVLLVLNRLPSTSSDEELLSGLNLLATWVTLYRQALS
ncbi:type III secretion chaperone protein SigE [Obesumbacterium proteus]|uniref:type III secretion chaperone protein SigE n=1 Tax=Obesumbacterium proteus TaxID=82983 RepID=UPI002431543A|nr:type III secretion chaperone protein SigE [Obesumbacterium proteus]